MKKLLVIGLALLLVVCMASSILAVSKADSQFKGVLKIEVNDDKGIQMAERGLTWLKDGYIYWEYKTKVNNGWSGGFKIRIEPEKTKTIYYGKTATATKTDQTQVVLTNDTVKIDNGGWVKWEKGILAVTLDSEIEEKIGDELKEEYKTSKNPGLQIDAKPLSGLSLTGMIIEADGANTSHYLDYLAKGSYTGIPGLSLNAGYFGAANNSWDAANAKTAMAFWGSYTLVDLLLTGSRLTIGGEYNTRDNAGTVDTAIIAKVGYTVAPIGVNIKFLNKTDGFYFLNKKDQYAVLYNAYDFFSNAAGSKAAGSMIDASVSYDVLKGISLVGVVDYYLGDGTVTKLDASDSAYATAYDGTISDPKNLGFNVYVQSVMGNGITNKTGYTSFFDSKIYSLFEVAF